MSDKVLAGPHQPLLSIVTPAYNEAENLPALYERLATVLNGIEADWEWIVVDDHSSDATFSVVAGLARDDQRIRGFRLARNGGSHAAIACGLSMTRGRAAIVLAADGQDPPATIPSLVGAWREGAQVVWAARQSAATERRRTSSLYYWLMRRLVGLSSLPREGADCVLLDRAVVRAVRRFHERHISLLALINWMGFRQTSVPGVREPRAHGRSGWTLARKVKLLVDSVTGFTYLPIRAISGLGLVTAVAGLLYAGVVIVNAVNGRPPEGWSSLMVTVLLLGGVQMLMLGVLGEYVWRALEEARRRPKYLIEARTPAARSGRMPVQLDAERNRAR
jgi:dolichol-phosphate mannosyltransferase